MVLKSWEIDKEKRQLFKCYSNGLITYDEFFAKHAEIRKRIRDEGIQFPQAHSVRPSPKSQHELADY